MKTMARIALGIVLLLALQAQAQEPGDTESRYAVEILVFRNLDQSRSTPETPVPGQPLVAAEPAPGLPPEAHLEFLLLDPAAGQPEFVALAPDELSLAKTWQRLERLDAYQPLAYLSWSQPARSQAAAQARLISETGTAPPGLSGQVTLYKERFLHLDIDLAWQASPADAPGPDGLPAPVARIDESRLLRGDLAQYFDNPRFGAIAYVRELTPAASPATTAEPAG